MEATCSVTCVTGRTPTDNNLRLPTLLEATSTTSVNELTQRRPETPNYTIRHLSKTSTHLPSSPNLLSSPGSKAPKDNGELIYQSSASRPRRCCPTAPGAPDCCAWRVWERSILSLARCSSSSWTTFLLPAPALDVPAELSS